MRLQGSIELGLGDHHPLTGVLQLELGGPKLLLEAIHGRPHVLLLRAAFQEPSAGPQETPAGGVQGRRDWDRGAHEPHRC